MLKPDAPSAGGSGDAADRPSVVASTGVVGSSSSTSPDSTAYAAYIWILNVLDD